MNLPTIDYQPIQIKSHTLQRNVKFRPILVREEKLLLMAKEMDTQSDIYSAVKRVVTNCCLDQSVDFDKLPLFELEYFFLNLRISSIGGIVELSYRDSEDQMERKFKIDLSQIKLVVPEGCDTNIKLNDEYILTMRFPPAKLFDDKKFLDAETTSDSFDVLVTTCMQDLWKGEDVVQMDGYSLEEKLEWLDSLQPAAYKLIQEFFLKIPHMYYEIVYTNKNGTERKIPLRTLSDFFML